MLAQLLQQQFMSGFKTAQMNLLALNDGGIQHAADQPFRERIGHADVKQQVRLFAIVIKALEERLQGKLFKRKGRGLEPSELGELVFRYADRMFTLSQEMLDIVNRLRRAHDGPFFIHVPEVVQMIVVNM